MCGGGPPSGATVVSAKANSPRRLIGAELERDVVADDPVGVAVTWGDDGAWDWGHGGSSMNLQIARRLRRFFFRLHEAEEPA